jgi:hypothetical protein
MLLSSLFGRCFVSFFRPAERESVCARNDLGVENLLPRPSISRKRIVPQVLARWHRPPSKTTVGLTRERLAQAAYAPEWPRVPLFPNAPFGSKG